MGLAHSLVNSGEVVKKNKCEQLMSVLPAVNHFQICFSPTLCSHIQLFFKQANLQLRSVLCFPVSFVRHQSKVHTVTETQLLKKRVNLQAAAKILIF